MKKNKLVYGFGINDVDHPVYEIKSYHTWKRMLCRCYDPKLHAKYPTYIGVTVCAEWLYYSNFKKWFDEHFVEGWHLDKDLLDKDNREYGPEKCLFVPARINSLVTDHGRDRGEWPIGVYYDGHRKKFKAMIRNGYGKNKHIGYFSTPEAAHLAWLKAKREIVDSLKPELDAIHPDLYEAIMSRYPLPEAANDPLHWLQAA